MRNMSFALTTKQFKARTKTVTRRFGWWRLRPGDVLMGIEKGMGLRAGERVVRLGPIEIVSVRSEPLNAITNEDCALEGFPEMQAEEFVSMLVKHYRCDPNKIVNRIEYRYLQVDFEFQS